MVFGFFGQFLGLLIINVLQAMLEVAQEYVGRVEIGSHLSGQLSVFPELLQHFLCGTDAQPGILSAAYQLEYLRGEFDLAYAARAELDVVEAIAALHLPANLRV